MKSIDFQKIKSQFLTQLDFNSTRGRLLFLGFSSIVFCVTFLVIYRFMAVHPQEPSEEEIIELDSIAAKARDLTRINPRESLTLTLELLSKSQKSNYQRGLGNSYRLLALASVQARNFVLTQDYIQKAKEIFIELNDYSGLGDLENTYGSLFIYMGDTVDAIGPFRRAFEIYSQLDRKDRMRVAAFNLAFSYSAIPNLDSSRYFLEISEKLKTRKEDVPGFGITQGLRGKIAYLEGYFPKAKQSFQDALAYYYDNKEQESFVAFFESILFLARMYEAEGDLDAAQEILIKGTTSESIYLSESLSRQIYIHLIKIYESKGDYLSAYEVFWEKERFEAELERRKVELSKNFSAELTLFQAFQIENDQLSGRLTLINRFILLGGLFTFFLILLFVRLLFLNAKNKELKLLVEKSHELADISTFHIKIDTNLDLDIFSTTPTALNVLKLSAVSKDITKIPLTRLLDESEIERVRQVGLEYGDANRFFNEEFRITNLANEVKILRLIGKVYGEVDGYVIRGILLDKTLETQALETIQLNLEKEKALKELRGQMMHMTSHEFRTPLSIVSNAVELVGLQIPKVPNLELQEKLERTISSARSNISKLVSMLDELLLYERLQSDEFELNFESVELTSFLSVLVDEVIEGKNPQPKVEFHFPKMGLNLTSDRKLLYHITSNLLSNSIKYLDKDLPIEIYLEKDSSHIHLRIKDQGIGIPESDIERLFTPFKRASNVGNRQGTGLGLSIVKRMVDRLGGKLHVESKVGEYTQFTVSFPND